MIEDLEQELEKLIKKYNKQAKKEKAFTRVALVKVDQSIPEEDLEHYDPEDIPTEFDEENCSWSIITMFPQEMEDLFYEHGWFPSSFC